MDELDHLPLPPDEPARQTNLVVQLTPLPVEFIQPLIPAPPVAVSIRQEPVLVPVVAASQTPIKKIRIRAVLATVFVGLIGIVLSGSAAVYFTYSKIQIPLNQRRAKPVIRHPVLPPPMIPAPEPIKAQAHLKSHSGKTSRKSSKAKSSTKKNLQHKPWFSNAGQ